MQKAKAKVKAKDCLCNLKQAAASIKPAVDDVKQAVASIKPAVDDVKQAVASMPNIGPPPKEYAVKINKAVVRTVNTGMIALQSKLISDSPVDVGILKNAWNFIPATSVLPKAIIGTSSAYFLPTEMGRKPGKGISAEGQQNVQAWAQRVLGKSEKDSKGFAFMLSRKYKREGRPALGFAGLATPGSIPSGASGDEIKEITGGTISNAFKGITASLSAIPPIA